MKGLTLGSWLLLALGWQASAAVSVPAPVLRAASIAARDHSGIVLYVQRNSGALSVGPYRRGGTRTTAYLFSGERLLGARVLQYVKDGKTLGRSELAAEERNIRAGSTAPGFAVPFDRRSFGDYRYSVNGESVAFQALRRDERHGDGSWLMNAAGHVTFLEYAPVRLPQYARNALISEVRGEVLPGYWATTRGRSRYTGRYGVFAGSYEAESTYSGFRRFASESTGRAALHSMLL